MTSVTVSVSLAALLAGLVSLVPAGGATATMLVSEPVALAVTAPLSVRLAVWPVARLSPVHAPVSGLYLPAEGRPKIGLDRATASIRVRLLSVSGPLLVTAIV